MFAEEGADSGADSGTPKTKAGSVTWVKLSCSERLRGSGRVLLLRMARSPSSAHFPSFLGEGSPTKVDKTGKIRYPYSKL